MTIVAEDVAFVDPPAELPAGEVALAIDIQGVHDITINGPDGTIAGAFGGRPSAGEVTSSLARTRSTAR